MKYIIILLFIFIAGCDKDDLEISDLYKGSVTISHTGQFPPDTTINNVKVEVHRISDDSLFFLQRTPFTVPVGVVEDTIKFGARLGNSGSFNIPAFKDTLSGGSKITVTGSGDIGNSTLSYSAVVERFSISSYYTFTGTAQ